jgi:superfamily II DNA or RNA helicase
MPHPFSGCLNDTQREAADSVLTKLSLDHKLAGGMLVLPCGYGKTVVSLYIAVQLKRRTLVIVHKSFLVDQWQERVRMFIPGASVGKIQRDTVDENCDITIGMVQSLATRAYPEDVISTFGFVIVDEAHHMSAPVFCRALRQIPARKVLALSATPDRRDGMTNLLFWSMGDILYRIVRDTEVVHVSCMIYEGVQKEIKCRDGTVNLSRMLTCIARDRKRNELICDEIRKYAMIGRQVMVLSDRIEQLKSLETELSREGELTVSMYIGATPREDRQRAESSQIILSTWAMSKEGLDIPTLDTLIMASPKGDVEQGLGRILRKCKSKQVPLVIDVVDPYSIFQRLRWKRWNYYKKQMYECKTMALDPGLP